MGIPFQIIEPEKHHRYFTGDFLRRLKRNHRVMRVQTYDRRKRRSSLIHKASQIIPGIRGQKFKTYSVVTTDEAVECGEPYVFTLQPIDLDMLYVAEEVEHFEELQQKEGDE